MSKEKKILAILGKAKKLAQRFRVLTGKPLGVTGEVAEYEASRILHIKLTPARHAGYDAIEVRKGRKWRLQIKGRWLFENSKRGQRLGSIDVKKPWDSVLMVLLDHNLDAYQIWEAKRSPILKALAKPGSKARNERGALSISKFKALGELRWERKKSLDKNISNQILKEG